MKYETAVLLGEGGMGEVYKAYDPTLNRPVALKFLRHDNPLLLERLLREARLQARVEHENVCKVYEVGELSGKPFIAMQYIEGKTLDKAAREMTLEQKLQVMESVAEAVHAAHRMGLVHRDLKPGNILVENKQAEGWKPYVLDFGLAREHDATGLTETGLALGTPPYMAPEQARGELHRLDRRTDVYSLGAVLYELLAGHPPFEGKSLVELLIKAAQEEPTPLRRLDPGIPPDLETVVMKCLEKEPQRRYESARALALDLRRYREGEPIEARPSGLAYRLAKKARKNRAVVAVAAVGLAVAVALLSMWLRARWTASERALLAQRFGQEVQAIEGILRQAYLLPLHDTRPEKARVRERIKAIEAGTTRAGPVAEGPGHYAMGRGSLALRNYEEARRHLERAWAAGYRPPEAAYALGHVLGVLYQRALRETQRIADKERREQRRKEVERSLRDPALAYLGSAVGGAEVPVAFVEGEIAFYEKRYGDAARKAGEALALAPSLYEARVLLGEAATAEGIEGAAKGDFDAALKAFDAAKRAYGEAVEIARSDAGLYEKEARRANQAMNLAISHGLPFEAAFRDAVDACTKALEADPESAGAAKQCSQAYEIRSTLSEEYLGVGDREAIETAVKYGERAVTLDPNDADAHNHLGNARMEVARLMLARSQDPAAAMDSAVESFRVAVRLDPGYAYAYNNMGAALQEKAEFQLARGVDPRPALDLAIASYGKRLELGAAVSPYNNLGNAYYTRAKFERAIGLDPGPTVEKAAACFEKALALNPSHALALRNLGNTLLVRADHAVAHGVDPAPWLEKALAACGESLRINPKYTHAMQCRGDALLTRARFEILAGLDPRRSLGSANESYSAAHGTAAADPDVLAAVALAHLVEAEAAMKRGADPGGSLSRARGALAKAAAGRPDDAAIHLLMGRIETLAARGEQRAGRTPREHFGRAQTALDRAAALNPRNAEILHALTDLARRRIAWLGSGGSGSKQDVAAGLEMADRALSINPRMAETLAARGALLLLRARAERDPRRRVDAAAETLAALQRAQEENPLLGRDPEYRALVAEARGMQGARAP